MRQDSSMHKKTVVTGERPKGTLSQAWIVVRPPRQSRELMKDSRRICDVHQINANAEFRQPCNKGDVNHLWLTCDLNRVSCGLFAASP